MKKKQKQLVHFTLSKVRSGNNRNRWRVENPQKDGVSYTVGYFHYLEEIPIGINAYIECEISNESVE